MLLLLTVVVSLPVLMLTVLLLPAPELCTQPLDARTASGAIHPPTEVPSVVLLFCINPYCCCCCALCAVPTAVLLQSWPSSCSRATLPS
jgi:hypothetical protein